MWTYFNYLPFQILLFQLEQPVRTDTCFYLTGAHKKNGNARLILYNALYMYLGRKNAYKMVPCKLNFFIFAKTALVHSYM